eukprot:scaffold43924_cov61-Phaeocystis_antarctica.AAC.2
MTPLPALTAFGITISAKMTGRPSNRRSRALLPTCSSSTALESEQHGVIVAQAGSAQGTGAPSIVSAPCSGGSWPQAWLWPGCGPVVA